MVAVLRKSLSEVQSVHGAKQTPDCRAQPRDVTIGIERDLPPFLLREPCRTSPTMLPLNDSSVQRTSPELHADRDATFSFYTASTFPITPTRREDTKWLTGPVATMYILCFSVAGVAVLLNMVIFAAVLRYARKPRPYTILVLNLCASDCVLSVATIVMYALQYARLHAMDSGTPSGMLATIYCCQFVFQEIVWTVTFYGSMLTIVTMSAYHLMALRWPPSKFCLESKQCIAVALIWTWSLALCLGLPQWIMVATSYHSAMERCPLDLPQFCCQISIYRTPRYLMNQELHKKIIYSVFAGVIMSGLLFILCVYSYLVTKIWTMRRVKLMAHKTQEDLTAAEIAWRRLMATTAMLVAAFCVFWLPHVAYMCLHGLRLVPHLMEKWEQEELHMLKVALHTLGCLCCIADPLIYCLRVPQVRNSIQKAPGIRHIFACDTSIRYGAIARKQKCAVNV